MTSGKIRIPHKQEQTTERNKKAIGYFRLFRQTISSSTPAICDLTTVVVSRDLCYRTSFVFFVALERRPLAVIRENMFDCKVE
jgi:hypothetical protein